MSSLDTIVDLTITVEPSGPSRAGFGTPLIAAYHTKYLDLVREYSDPSELVDDGFLITDPTYLIMNTMWAQDPHPKTCKVGRRALAYTQLFDLFPVNTTEGFVYTFTIDTTVISYTVLAAATVATIVTALQPLIDAVSTVTATDDTTHVSVSNDTPGTLVAVDLSTMDPVDDLKYEDITVDPGIATDLTAISAIDDDWYGLILDSNSALEIASAAAWVETKKKIMPVNSTDSEIVDVSVTDDVISALTTLSYKRTPIWYSRRYSLSYMAAAALAVALPKDPGTLTWCFKTLVGVAVNTLKAGWRTVVENKGGNIYVPVAGKNISWQGKAPNGDFIDVVRFIDFLYARIQEDTFAVLQANDKIPFTDIGGALLGETVKTRLLSNVSSPTKALGLSNSPKPTVTVPAVTDVSIANKGNRHFPDVNFNATLAGAIHTTKIVGKIAV
jgi:hypothetical protein